MIPAVCILIVDTCKRLMTWERLEIFVGQKVKTLQEKIRDRNIRVVVLIVHPNDGRGMVKLTADHLVDLRKSAGGLPSNAMFLVGANEFDSHLPSTAFLFQKLADALVSHATQFYKDALRKYAKYIKTAAEPNQWCRKVRHMFKSGYFYEFLGESSKAIAAYQKSFELLHSEVIKLRRANRKLSTTQAAKKGPKNKSVTDNFNNTTSDHSHSMTNGRVKVAQKIRPKVIGRQQFKCVGGLISWRMCNLLLLLSTEATSKRLTEEDDSQSTQEEDEYLSRAINQFRNLVRLFRAPNGRIKSVAVTENVCLWRHFAWLTRQYISFAELLEGYAELKKRTQEKIEMARQFQRQPDPSKKGRRKGRRKRKLKSTDNLMDDARLKDYRNPAHYYRSAAIYTVERRRAAHAAGLNNKFGSFVIKKIQTRNIPESCIKREQKNLDPSSTFVASTLDLRRKDAQLIESNSPVLVEDSPWLGGQPRLTKNKSGEYKGEMDNPINSLKHQREHDIEADTWIESEVDHYRLSLEALDRALSTMSKIEKEEPDSSYYCFRNEVNLLAMKGEEMFALIAAMTGVKIDNYVFKKMNRSTRGISFTRTTSVALSNIAATIASSAAIPILLHCAHAYEKESWTQQSRECLLRLLISCGVFLRSSSTLPKQFAFQVPNKITGEGQKNIHRKDTLQTTLAEGKSDTAIAIAIAGFECCLKLLAQAGQIAVSPFFPPLQQRKICNDLLYMVERIPYALKPIKYVFSSVWSFFFF